MATTVEFENLKKARQAKGFLSIKYKYDPADLHIELKS